jgi:ABC-type transport system substrate-binding protein
VTIVNSEDVRSQVSRRTLIRASGAVTAGALFGTATSFGSIERGPGGTETTFRTYTETTPTDVQFNPRNEQHRSRSIEALLFEPLAEYDPVEETFSPVLAKEWAFDTDSRSFEITLREGYTWHEVTQDGTAIGGQPIDAFDLERQLRLDEQFGADYWDVTETISVPDTETVRLEFDRAVNEDVLRFDLLDRRLHHPPTYFGDDSVDYGEMAIRPAEGDPPVGSGPFKFAEMADEGLTLEVAEEHPASDDLEIDEFVFEDRGSESEQWAGLADAELSGTGQAYFPELFRRHEGATPVESLTQLEAPSDAGWGVLINHRHPLLADRSVRKAIAHVFSSAEAVGSMTDSVPQQVSLLTGLSPEKTERYLDDELGRFETYGDRKRAAELLGRAGFERTWEEWFDPRGGPATFGFLAGGNPHADDGDCFAPAEPAWFYGARAFVHQLQDFLRHDDDSIPEYGAEMIQGFSGVGEHDDVFAFLPARQWGHFDGAHPYHNFRSDLLVREASNLGYGPVVKVPPYDDPTAPVETVDIRERLDALREATTESEERDLVRELAWIVNETVPYLQGHYRPSVAYVDDRFWEVRGPNATASTDELVRAGDLEPRRNR